MEKIVTIPSVQSSRDHLSIYYEPNHREFPISIYCNETPKALGVPESATTIFLNVDKAKQLAAKLHTLIEAIEGLEQLKLAPGSEKYGFSEVWLQCPECLSKCYAFNCRSRCCDKGLNNSFYFGDVCIYGEEAFDYPRSSKKDYLLRAFAACCTQANLWRRAGNNNQEMGWHNQACSFKSILELD